MRVGTRILPGLLLCGIASPAMAGIVVTSFTTTVDTNAYAPFSESEYFDQQKLTNVSPAVADVSDDWTGTNVGGTTATWHWIGASHAETTTAFDDSSLTITGSGSFSYDMTTTSDFVDPIHSGGVFTPGGAADYRCLFSLDTPATYRVTGSLDGFGVVAFGSSDGGDVFRFGSNSGSFDRAGTIPPGHYGILLNTSNSMGQLPSRANHVALSGTFSVPEFTITVPEPDMLLVWIGAISLASLLRRSRPAAVTGSRAIISHRR